MTKTKKTNPRRIPATAADVKAAHEKGQRESIEFALAVAWLSVCDVFGPTEDRLGEFHEKFMTNCALIRDGKIKFADVIETLKDEYGLEIEFR